MQISCLVHMALLLLLMSCGTSRQIEKLEGRNIEVTRLSPHTFLHTSYLQTETYGRVACNGLIVVNGGEALLLDTPVDDTASLELLGLLQEVMHVKVKGVVATHFHVDCLGGLGVFHAAGIPSWANTMTLALAKEQGSVVPLHGFDRDLPLQVAGVDVTCLYPGEGHTRDNVVCYIPADGVLFGGCLVKAMGSGKGNLEDANTEAWTATVQHVRDAFPGAEIVVPGHGKPGGMELLVYTMEKFRID